MYLMNKLLKKILLLALVSIPTFFGRIQNVYSQPALHDTLRRVLTSLEQKTKDDILRKAIREAKTLYTSNAIDDSLAKKLLIIDSVLVKAAPPDQPVALSYAKALVQLFKELPPKQEHLDYAASLSRLADFFVNIRQYENALPLYQQALAIKKKVLGEENPDYLKRLHNLADLYRRRGLYGKALPLYKEALAFKKKTLGEEHLKYANSLNDLSVAYWRTGQYDIALPLYKQALAIRGKALGEDSRQYVLNLKDLAMLYAMMGQYEKALSLYQQCLAIGKKALGEGPSGYASILNNLANLYKEMGQYDKALPLYQQALALRKKVPGKEHTYSYSLYAMAGIYMEMGQYDKALQLYQQTLAIRKKFLGEEHIEYVCVLRSMADLYYNIGQYEKALRFNEQVLAISKKVAGEQHPDYAYSLASLARLYIEMGHYKKAMPLCRQTLLIRKKILGEEHREYALALNNLAVLYYKTGQYGHALPLQQQALTIIKKVLGEEHPDYSHSLNNLALLYTATGDLGHASALLMEASERALKYLNQTYATLSEQEKMKFLQIRAAQFDFLPSFLSAHGERSYSANQVYANELALKGMVLEDQQGVLNSIRKSGDSTGFQLYQQWRSNKTFLGRQLLLPASDRISAMDSLQELTDQLEQQLSRGTASFRNLQHSRVITVRDIVQKLQKGEAAVEFICFRQYNKKWTDSTIYAALVLLPGDISAHFIPLFEEKQLQNLFKSSSKKVNPVAAIQKLYSGNSLYQLIWKPLEKYLTGVNTLYYAPAGLLHRIAFQAIQTKSGHLLINNYQLNQVLSTRSVALPLQVKKPGSAAIWANIQYSLQTEAIGGDSAESASGMDPAASSFNFYTWDTRELRGKEWRPLASTKQEMESITKELQQAGTAAAIDSGTVATEEAFKALDGKSPEVLHLATHGFFLPAAETKPNDRGAGSNVFIVQQNPMFRSGLVLAGANHIWKGGSAIPGKEDGILTAYEIAQMDLSNTDLVVLSACETALGDLQGNEGVIGLQRAFKMAGVKQLIVSLWRVPDKETAELMKLFYGNWLRGQSSREALRSAQLKMKEKYASYFWAAFVVVE